MYLVFSDIVYSSIFLEKYPGEDGRRSFWNKKKPFNGLHTVTVQLIEGKIVIYNRYNSKDFPYEYASRNEVLPKKSDFICGYLIEEER